MWYTLTIKEIIRKLKSNTKTGLTNKEVIERREKYGENKLIENKKTSIIVRFFNQFKDFMIIALILAAIISAGLSYVERTNEYVDSAIIIAIVVLNAIMGVIQESKAEKSLEALKKMSAPTCKVKRDGEIIQIESLELVPGDIVYLETGSYVPADIRLIKTYNLKIEESALTGEGVAVEKNSNCIIKEDAPVGDILNIAFATTIVVRRTWRRNSCRNRNEY